ncbi:nucleotidyltransferase domain-containing protein [Bifidobacterium tissieri]|uniref:Nucleotidyltransferase domain-containing protein n=1 Tax=Bifidobacterium tissieri TaxID=1630162 RepID=A0A261FDN6_9BIFI|nr:nucleotidyltransferase domain-containing protein [Bifidobacterium tissieri]OZG57145.1 nucleotidyltransferase domain-containing protein [Bifidobacterium tissieri]
MRRSLIDLYTWRPQVVAALCDAFGDSLRCVGLQGSYLRGEANPDSGIDLLVILNDMDIDDLSTLRRVIRDLPYGERVVMFASGRRQLAHWPMYELFQFAQGTETWYGSLENNLPSMEPRDTVLGAQASLASLYHLTNNAFLRHGDDLESCVETLHAAYKHFFFSLQIIEYLRTGRFLPTKSDLLEVCVRDGHDDEARMMELSIDDNSIRIAIADHDLNAPYRWLLDWVSRSMRLLG